MSHAAFVERLESYDFQVGVRRKLQSEFPASYSPCPACSEEMEGHWCSLCLGTRLVTRGTVTRYDRPAVQ